MWNYFMLFSRSKISSLFFSEEKIERFRKLKQSKLARFGSQFSTISYISKNGRCKMENRMRTISIKIFGLISEMSTNPNDKPHWRRSVREWIYTGICILHVVVIQWDFSLKITAYGWCCYVLLLRTSIEIVRTGTDTSTSIRRVYQSLFVNCAIKSKWKAFVKLHRFLLQSIT